MLTIVQIGGRWSGNKEAEKWMKQATRWVNKIMHKLAKEMEFTLPRYIIVRPLYFKTNNPYSVFGRAIWTAKPEEFTIALNIPFCMKMRDKGKWVVEHECAHIASALKHNHWGHGHHFQTTRRMAMRNK